MDNLIRFIRNAPKAQGADRIYLPGEMEWGARERALQDGMILPDHVMVRLKGLAEDYGLPSRRFTTKGEGTMLNKQEVMGSLKDIGVVAVLRADDPADLIEVVVHRSPAGSSTLRFR